MSKSKSPMSEVLMGISFLGFLVFMFWGLPALVPFLRTLYS